MCLCTLNLKLKTFPTVWFYKIKENKFSKTYYLIGKRNIFNIIFNEKDDKKSITISVLLLLKTKSTTC
jgi:hypothetical protein